MAHETDLKRALKTAEITLEWRRRMTADWRRLGMLERRLQEDLQEIVSNLKRAATPQQTWN